MSIVHNIISKRPLDISRVNIFASTIDGIKYEERGEKTFYYWINGKSTRGFEITLEQEAVEVRNMVLSNRYDYELTNKIVAEIIALTDGRILNEEEQETVLPIWDNNKIAETEIHDCEITLSLSKEHKVSICGPIRNVHFGKRMYKKFKSLKGEHLKDKMFDLILYVNYQIPNFESGNIMMVGKPNSNEDPKKMKVLSCGSNYIIDKYDYILLYVSEGQNPIIITNDILNSILPHSWELVDDYTVVAPMIEQNEWDKLLVKARKHDLWKNFINN